MSFTRKWMELQIITLSEVNQIQKDKYHIFSLACDTEEGKKMK